MNIPSVYQWLYQQKLDHDSEDATERNLQTGKLNSEDHIICTHLLIMQHLWSKYSQIHSILFLKSKRRMEPKKADKNANMTHHH